MKFQIGEAGPERVKVYPIYDLFSESVKYMNIIWIWLEDRKNKNK